MPALPFLHRRAAAATLACASLGLLAGCGTKTLEKDDAEQEISKKVEELRNVKPKSVECPDDMEAKKGKKHTCKLTAPNGDVLDVKLTMLDDDGKFEFEVQEQ